MDKLYTTDMYLRESSKSNNDEEKEKIRKRWIATKAQILKQKNNTIQSLKKSLTAKMKKIGNDADASFIKTELKDAIDDTVDAYDTKMDKAEKRYHKELKDHKFKNKLRKKVYAGILAGTIAGHIGYQTYKHYKKKKKAAAEVDVEDKKKVKKLHEIYSLELLNRKLNKDLLMEIKNVVPTTPPTSTISPNTPGVKSAANNVSGLGIKLNADKQKLDIKKRSITPTAGIPTPINGENIVSKRKSIASAENKIKETQNKLRTISNVANTAAIKPPTNNTL